MSLPVCLCDTCYAVALKGIFSSNQYSFSRCTLTGSGGHNIWVPVMSVQARGDFLHRRSHFRYCFDPGVCVFVFLRQTEGGKVLWYTLMGDNGPVQSRARWRECTLDCGGLGQQQNTQTHSHDITNSQLFCEYVSRGKSQEHL